MAVSMKNNFKNKRKGFTLVELLAVIVILAIIMLISIPSVLQSMQVAKRKSFIEYADKTTILAQKQFAQEQLVGEKSGSDCYIYNIKTDLGLSNTGKFQGWILLNPKINDVYITLFNDDYALIGFHYSDSSLNVEEALVRKENVESSKLTINELCNSAVSCKTCNATNTELNNDNYKTKSYLLSGKEFSSTLFDILCPGVVYRDECGGPFDVVMDNSNVPENARVLSVDNSEYKTYAWADIVNNKVYIYSEAELLTLNRDSSNMFYYLPIIGFDYSRLDFSEVDILYYAFGGRRYNESIDLSNKDLSRVTNMSGMFASSKYESVNLSNSNASSVTDIKYMFQSCIIDNLNLDNFKIDKLKEVVSVFYEFSTNSSVNLNNWNVSGVTSLEDTFYHGTFGELHVEDWNVSNVTNMHETFGYTGAKELILNKWNTSKVHTVYNLFQYSNIDKIDISNWKLNDLETSYSLYQLFYRSTVKELKLNNVDLSNNNSINGFIYMCSNLVSLDLSNVNFSGIKNLNKFIYDNPKLEVIDMRNVDLSSVTYGYKIITYCPSLTTIYANEKTKLSEALISNYNFFESNLPLLHGKIDYNENKTSGAYANYENGYFTYKA